MSKPSDVVNIALAEVGYREKASNAYLDDKTANAGTTSAMMRWSTGMKKPSTSAMPSWSRSTRL